MEQRPPYRLPHTEQQTIYQRMQERAETQERRYHNTPRAYIIPMNIGRNFPRQQ